jgi:hypothetical protein
MGTRSLTFIYGDESESNDVKNAILCMYRQFDGYPSGHGKELAEFIKSLTIVNGIGGGEKMGTHANGIECLAAQLVKEFKKEIGGIYLMAPAHMDKFGHAGEEYRYHLWEGEPGEVHMRVEDSARVLLEVNVTTTENLLRKKLFLMK